MASRWSSRGRGRAAARSTAQTSTIPLYQPDFVRNGAAGMSLGDKYQLAVSNVPPQVDFTTIREAFEQVLRPREDPTQANNRNRGTGVIYLNDENSARLLAARVNEYPIKIGYYEFLFQKQDGTLSQALQTPYRRPAISREAIQRRRRNQEALGHNVLVLAVQFGIEGRDRKSFSVEWEGDYNPNAVARPGQQQKRNKPRAYLKFNEGQEGDYPHSLQIEISGPLQPEVFRITIPINQIRSLENGWVDGAPFIMMRLYNPPSFETKPQLASLTGGAREDFQFSWQRLSSLEPAHERVVGFASRALRLVITSDETHLENFIKMSRFVRLPRLAVSLHADIYRGNLYSRRRLEEVQRMTFTFPWAIGFQCDTLLRNCLLFPREILELKGEIGRLASIGTRFAEEVLKLALKLLAVISISWLIRALDCDSILCGSFLHLSNPNFGEVNAHTIRVGLGDFSKVIDCPARFGAHISQAFSSTDTSVELKPQEIEVIDDRAETQLQYGDNEDLRPRELVWTDGHGTISPDLADNIWEKLCEIRPKGIKHSQETEEEVRPRAFQIRLGGYKGVVSVDYRLEGRLIRLRPSMNKFDAPHSLGLEISEAFNRPNRMFLNRPLIMLLDTLGVNHSVFVKLQNEELENAQAALNHPDDSANLMETYELGKAFGLPDLLRQLAKHGLRDLHSRDPFFRKLSSFALYHVK
ncbi:hypothetical protein FRC01_007777, partial [Tulasnella sp. 417]